MTDEMTLNHRKCSTCIFYTNGKEHGGFCDRYPPTICLIMHGDAGPAWEQARPWVTPDHLCGEHRAGGEGLRK